VNVFSFRIVMKDGVGRNGKSLSTDFVTDASRGLKRTFDAMNVKRSRDGMGMSTDF